MDALVRSDPIAALSFPSPPYRISGARLTLAQRIVAGFILVFFPALLLLMTVGYFGFDRNGRALLVDTALALDLGEYLPAEIRVGTCDRYGSSAPWRFSSSGWHCPLTVVHSTEVTAFSIDVNDPADAKTHAHAGRILGAIGVRWPGGVMITRWVKAGLLLLAIVVLALVTASVVLAMRSITKPRRVARRGTIQSVDLLTVMGSPSFSFVDQGGRRRFAHAPPGRVPLTLDGVATVGAAIIAGRNAALLREDLAPVELPAAERERILASAADVQQRALVRAPLPLRPGDRPTLAARIAAIETALRASVPDSALSALFEDAWRLVWDSTDTGISRRAMLARDDIARRLGPARSYDALARSRATAAET
jgi:hypothetical protein